jgi:hypothetical protein
MLIKINKTDCQNIVNQNLRVGGGVTPNSK